MPLLGRHKSASSTQAAATGAASGGQSTQATGARSQQQVCESPLFGLRKQLVQSSPSGFATAASERPAPGTGGNCGTTTTTAGMQASNELNSIPQQITREQIHYAFSIMDTNQDGVIDLRDLSQMLANLGVPIDEAILSHIMSSVSKRGDHRVSEAEFLEWISHFIQINDSPSRLPVELASRQSAQQQQQQLQQRGFRQHQRSPEPADGRRRGRTRVFRSSTAGCSLVAEPAANEVAPRTRRGSGSGLALMRSLSSSPSGTGTGTAPGTGTGTGTGTGMGAGSGTATGAQVRCRSESQFSLGGNGYGKEFNAEAAAAESEARDDLKAAFCVFDLDGDGFITLDEVRAGLKLLGESWSPGELRALFSKCSSKSPSPPLQQTSPSSSSSGDLSSQRINIDDFVKLLL